MGYLERRVGHIFHLSESTLSLTFSQDRLACVLVLIDRCPDGETPGESPQEMSDRVDRVIAKIRKTHQEVRNFDNSRLYPLRTANIQVEDAASCPEESESCDYMIFSHGHFTRCFIARWCDFPINAGYHFSADPGCVSDFENRKFRFEAELTSSLLFLDTSTTPSRSLVSYLITRGSRLMGSAPWIELVH